MRRVLTALFALALAMSASAASFDVQWYLPDFAGFPNPGKVRIMPTASPQVLTNGFMVGGYKDYSTAWNSSGNGFQGLGYCVTNYSLIVSNIQPGTYWVQFFGPNAVTSITNNFPTTNGLVNASDFGWNSLVVPGATAASILNQVAAAAKVAGGTNIVVTQSGGTNIVNLGPATLNALALTGAFTNRWYVTNGLSAVTNADGSVYLTNTVGASSAGGQNVNVTGTSLSTTTNGTLTTINALYAFATNSAAGVFGALGWWPQFGTQNGTNWAALGTNGFPNFGNVASSNYASTSYVDAEVLTATNGYARTNDTHALWLTNVANIFGGKMTNGANRGNAFSSPGTGTGSEQFGSGALATGNNSLAVGNGATATNSSATAIGASSLASLSNDTAVGHLAQATGGGSSALGEEAQANGYASTAFGFGAFATGYNSTAIGASSLSSGSNSFALGGQATASGSNSYAVGFFATSAFNNSMAFGASVTTTTTNQILFGTASQYVQFPGNGSVAGTFTNGTSVSSNRVGGSVNGTMFEQFSTNDVRVTNASPANFNGTYVLGSAQVWTNQQDSRLTLNFQNPTYFLSSNGVNYFSASTPASQSWTVLAGTTAPVTSFGGKLLLDGFEVYGFGVSTGMVYQATNGLGSAAFSAASAFDTSGSALNATNNPSLVRTNILYGLTNQITGITNPIGAAAYSQVGSPQPASANLTNWNGLGTNIFPNFGNISSSNYVTAGITNPLQPAAYGNLSGATNMTGSNSIKTATIGSNLLDPGTLTQLFAAASAGQSVGIITNAGSGLNNKFTNATLENATLSNDLNSGNKSITNLSLIQFSPSGPALIIEEVGGQNYLSAGDGSYSLLLMGQSNRIGHSLGTIVLRRDVIVGGFSNWIDGASDSVKNDNSVIIGGSQNIITPGGHSSNFLIAASSLSTISNGPTDMSNSVVLAGYLSSTKGSGNVILGSQVVSSNNSVLMFSDGNGGRVVSATNGQIILSVQNGVSINNNYAGTNQLEVSGWAEFTKGFNSQTGIVNALTIASNPFASYSTNDMGLTNAGTAGANGTFRSTGNVTWTNCNGNGYYWIVQGGILIAQPPGGGSNLYSFSTWPTNNAATVINGAAPGPNFQSGVDLNGSGLFVVGEFWPTNIAARVGAISNSLATNGLGNAATLNNLSGSSYLTNGAVSLLSPFGGNNIWTDPVSRFGTNDHLLGISWNGTLMSSLWWWQSVGNTNGPGSTWRGDFYFNQPQNYGDISQSSTNNNGSTLEIFNGNPTLWNTPGDAYRQEANASTNANSSGGGYGIARIGVVGGNPAIIDRVAVGMVLTYTNVIPQILPGWVNMVVNNGVLGWAFCKPGFTTGSMSDAGNYSLLVLDWTNGLVRIPYLQAGAYDPRTNKWRDVFTANPLNGNITIGNSNGSVFLTNFSISAAAMTMAAGTGSPANVFAIGNDSLLVDRSGNVTAGSGGLGNTGIFRAARHIATAYNSDQYLNGLGYGMGSDASGDINFNSTDGQAVYIGGGTLASIGSQGQRTTWGTDGITNTLPVFSNMGFGGSRSNKLALAAITFPATTVPWTNTLNVDVVVYIDNTGVVGTAVKQDGTQIFGTVLANTFLTICLQRGEYFSETYTVGTPSATWHPFP